MIKKKVLYVFNGEKASGAEIVIERLMAYNPYVEAHLFIAKSEFSVDVEKKNLFKVIQIKELKKLNRSSSSSFFYYLKASKTFLLLTLKVIKYILQNKIDIVHSNTIVPATYLLPTIFICKILLPRKRFIWSDHDLKYYSKLDDKVSKICVKWYDKTLAVSNAVKSKYSDCNRVYLLYNGLDTNIFVFNNEIRKIARAKYKLEDEVILFLQAGVIAPRKGQLELIKAFEKLLVKHINIVLILAGGESEDELTYVSQVHSAINRSTNIRYIGKVSDMISLYNAADVVVSNSNIEGSEPLGTTIYEAMACKKILIASNTGGTSEIIDNMKNGFLFGAESVTELISSMENVCVNLRSFDKLREDARTKVVDVFNIHSMTKKYNKYLKELDN